MKASILAVPMVLMVAVSSCTNTIAGRPSAAPTPSSSTRSPSPTKAPTGPGPITGIDIVKQLIDTINIGLTTVTSLRAESTSAFGGIGGTTTQVDQNLSAGRVTAFRQSVGSGIELVSVNKVLYVKLPQELGGSTAKPWFRVRADSPNEFVRTMATDPAGFGFGTGQPATNDLLGGVSPTTPVTARGGELVGGVNTSHFRIGSDNSTLPKWISKSLPPDMVANYVDLWLDAAGKPVQIDETLSLDRTKTRMSEKITYNLPLDIQAPPTSQIGG